jgi:hypothetical protein
MPDRERIIAGWLALALIQVKNGAPAMIAPDQGSPRADRIELPGSTPRLEVGFGEPWRSMLYTSGACGIGSFP